MTSKEYFTDLVDEEADQMKDEAHRIGYIEGYRDGYRNLCILLETCPFEISEEARNWIKIAFLDI